MSLYGAALIVFLGLGRMRRGRYYAPLLVIVVQIVTALDRHDAVARVPVRGTNSTPGLLVIIAATLPYLVAVDWSIGSPADAITREAGLDLVDASAC